MKAAQSAKELTANTVTALQLGHTPPRVVNYVVAYAGPASLQTVHGWIGELHRELGVAEQALPEHDGRVNVAAPTIDAVIVMGKGFLYFDNVPMGFGTPAIREQNPEMKWIWADTKSGSLLVLFLLLQVANSNASMAWLNPLPYLSSVSVSFNWGP